MGGRTSVATLVAALALVVAGCADDAPTSDDGQGDSPDASPTSGTTTAPTGGPVDDPTVVEPTQALLDWQDTGVDAGTRLVRGADWEVAVDDGGGSAEVRPIDDGDGEPLRIAAGTGRSISEVLLDEDWAVVVRQDDAETAPSQVAVVDLATGDQRELVSPAPASGGSWAMTGGDLYYPTYGEQRAYCLATSALADAQGEDGWCAPARSGWSQLTASPDGVGIMTFDDARPFACRTVALLDGSVLPQPVEGPTDCLGWDVAATPGGALWSEVPKPRRQEEATFHAVADGGWFDLGPGTTGSAVPCGGSVFFTQDPQGPDDPARLMRWTPDRKLEIAYESTSRGNAFLGEPACAGNVLTLASFGEDGDEQVWASVS